MTETQVNPEHVRTFADARIAAWVHLREDWPEEELGALTIAPWGWESPDHWAATTVNYVEDVPAVLVEKATGTVTQPNWRDWVMGGLRDRMAKVGDWSEAPT